MKLKAIFNRQSFWILELFLFGLVLGIPFFSAGKTWIQVITEVPNEQKLLIVLGTFILGIIVEMWLKKMRFYSR